MPDEYYALSSFRFDEVSLVPAGDNDGAMVVLSKAQPDGSEMSSSAPINPGSHDTGRSQGGGTHHKDGWKNIDHMFKDDGSGTCALCEQPASDPIHKAAVKKVRSGSKKKTGDTLSSDKTPRRGGNVANRDEILKNLPDDVREELEELLKDGDKELADTKAKLEEATKEDEKEDETDPVEKALAKADPAVAAIIRKMQADAEVSKKAVEEAQTIAKAERDARIHREMIAKAAEYQNIPGTPDEKVAIFKALGEHPDPTVIQRVEQMLKAANAQLDDSELFSILGKTRSDSSNNGEVEGKIGELRKSDPSLSHERAYAKVMADNPELYARIVKEG